MDSLAFKILKMLDERIEAVEREGKNIPEDSDEYVMAYGAYDELCCFREDVILLFESKNLINSRNIH